jgi:protein O-mannosyl-transferase
VPRKALLALGAAAIVLAAAGAYLPALRGGFVWNDDTYLTENATLDGFAGLKVIWTEPKANEQYYPMVFTSYWIEKRIWGLAPLGYHLVNVLLHAGSAVLLWALLARLGLPAAWGAAALFALHPMCVESVAWVTERKNTLSLFLSLLAMLFSLAGSEEKNESRKEDFPRKGKRQRRAVAGAHVAGSAPVRRPLLSFTGFFLFVLALFAKTTAVVVPAVLLVLVWWRRGKVRRRDAGPLVPWFAAGIALAAHTAWLERTVVAASGKDWSLNVAERFVLAGRTILFYSQKFLLPLDLAFIYERWTIDARSAVQWLPALCAVVLVGLAWRFRERVGRGPLAFLLLYGGVLFPAMGFFNVYAMRYSYVADHFAYQAVAVACAGLVCGAATLLEGKPPAAVRAAAASGIVLLAVCGVLTFRQSRIYEAEEVLWRDTLAKSPGCFMCHVNYGFWLVNAGREGEAVPHFEASLRLKPDNVPALLNLGRIAERRGRLGEAAAHLRAAAKVDPEDRAVLVNLATVNTKLGNLDEAIAGYTEALRLGSSDDYLAHNGLGVALMQQGRVAEAAGHFREALRLRPGYDYARANLERALAALGPAPP